MIWDYFCIQLFDVVNFGWANEFVFIFYILSVLLFTRFRYGCLLNLVGFGVIILCYLFDRFVLLFYWFYYVSFHVESYELMIC